MASYNLTDRQKQLLKTIVISLENGELEEPIITTHSQIAGINKNFGLSLRGDIGVLTELDLMGSVFIPRQ